jgi:uncharacterized protein
LTQEVLAEEVGMPLDPFVVNVARLRRSPGARWHEVRSGPFDPDGSLRPAPGASTVPEGGTVRCDVWLEPYPGGVMVTGTVHVAWEGQCRRCTAPVGGELSVVVRERFVARGAPAREAPAREVRVRAPGGVGGVGGVDGDEEAYPIVDDRLDLGPLAREAVVLELPLAPLCSETCAGLCPSCGADRNHEQCRCVAPLDPRWASLSVLATAPGPEPSAGHAREAP